MRKTMRVLATLSILASSLLFAQSASAVANPYSSVSGNGNVGCSDYGFFIISNNAVIGSEDCNGAVIIPLGVTSIATGGFRYSSINSVTIPNSVTSIGNGAFEEAHYLASITIPDNVTELGVDVFKGDYNLLSATIGSGITTIPSRAFYGASLLASVTIPSSVTRINAGAFQHTARLTSFTIPNSVTYIGNSAFSVSYGGGLTSVTVPGSVTEIGANAFRGASQLTSVTLGNGITAIGSNAFAYTGSLTSITIPNSVQSLETDAFYVTPSLSSYRYCGNVLSEETLTYTFGERRNTCRSASISAGDVLDSKVATFANGVKLAEIPVSNALPAIKLAFTGTAPASLTVTPYTNPAPPSRTPFMTTNSPKIVDIVISGGHDGSDVKVCLDGDSTDHLYHYTGGQWVELGTRTYENNQVCGITNSFSPFVAAPVSPLTVPGAPTIGTATATGTTTATVDFTAPASDGGTPILSYTATSTPGGITGSATQAGSGTISITGLSPSTAYTFTVTANNLIGSSAASSASNSTATVGVPSAPTSIVATSTGKRSALVRLANSASNGGSNITSYTITASPGGLSKTFTVGSPTTLAYEFLNLEPNTSYTFSATATNAIGTSAATSSNSIRTDALVPAALSAITFTDDGTGTAGKLIWSGKNIDAVLYTGPANSYPGPFNFGAFSTSWNGTIRNLTPDTQYTISIFAISADGIGESKSLTFKTGSGVLTDAPKATAQVSSQLNQIISWVNQNSFVPGEAANINSLLTKFDALVTSAHRSFIKVPTSRVSKVEVKSLTPKACSVVSATAKVDAGLVTALTKDTCTISYTVSGASRAWATFVKDFTFQKVSK